MPFNDTTNKNGLIQTIEFWTGKGDTGISGDATLLKIMTSRINEAFNRVLPKALAYSRSVIRFDDANNTDAPIGTFNIVSGQNDYKIATDGDSLDILKIAAVRILQSATASIYVDLDVMTSDDRRATRALSPNSNDTGVPSAVLIRGNSLHFDLTPNYNATNGVKIYFERVPSYFASDATTKKPGIPRPFHELLALYASYDWLLVNEPDKQMLITRLEAQIARREREYEALVRERNPKSNVMSPKRTLYL